MSIDTSVNLDYEKYLPLRFAILHAKGILRELDFYIEDCSKRTRWLLSRMIQGLAWSTTERFLVNLYVT